jgi:hypothetical protein
MSDVSIIIQGPLNEISLKNIPTYKKYGKVIVSCWNGYDEELLKYIDDDVVFVCNDLMKVEHYNSHNVYYQAFTTHAGLEKSETKFSIKVRSDESYSSLDVFIKALNENPKCIITGDIFFWDEEFSFHISDHVISGDTKILLGTFDRVKNICETTPLDMKMVIKRRKFFAQSASSESLVMLSFLQEIGAIDNIALDTVMTNDEKTLRLLADWDMGNPSRCIELVKNHARVVPTVCMGNVFLSTLGHAPLVHGRLIKSGSEELLCLQSYGEIFADIEIGCES